MKLVLDEYPEFDLDVADDEGEIMMMMVMTLMAMMMTTMMIIVTVMMTMNSQC